MSLPWGEFITVWSLLAVNITSPGPNVLNTIASAMGSGRAAGLASALGVGLGIGIWCLSMSLGAAALFTLLPVARIVLTGVAVGLLVWFATRFLRSAWAGLRGRRLAAPTGGERLTFRASFLRSLAVNATNPKALTTWIAILGFFPAAHATGTDVAVLTAGTVAVAVGIHTAYALAFSTPVAARLYLRAAWAVTGLAGLFFLAFAARLAWETFRTGS